MRRREKTFLLHTTEWTLLQPCHMPIVPGRTEGEVTGARRDLSTTSSTSIRPIPSPDDAPLGDVAMVSQTPGTVWMRWTRCSCRVSM